MPSKYRKWGRGTGATSTDKELQALVRDVFDYRDGELYWRKKTGPKVVVGTRAGSGKSHGGYRRVRFYGSLYLEHRVVYLMHHGVLPQCIDHINGDPSDNRIENLRACTQAENTKNRGKGKNNSSGFKGVSWSAKSRKWKAEIKVNYKPVYLGLFDLPEEAHAAYKAAADEMHRDFANHG